MRSSRLTATTCRPNCSRKEFKLPGLRHPRRRPRDNLREAVRLFNEAGWEIPRRQNGQQGNRRTVQIEFLGSSPTAEVITGGLIEGNLRRMGIAASLRIVDTSQYIQRYQNFDFDAGDGGFPPVDLAGQRAARLLEFRLPPTRRAPATRPASRIRSSTR